MQIIQRMTSHCTMTFEKIRLLISSQLLKKSADPEINRTIRA